MAAFFAGILGAALVIGILLLLAALMHTLCIPSKKADYVPISQPKREALYAGKLSRMVQMETISHPDRPQPEKFRAFHQLLAREFPLVFERCEVQDLEGNLLVRWPGKERGQPIMLMSHQDVVPPGKGWGGPPFSGDIREGKVWGRGTADTKGSVMAFYQAVEELLEQGYTPRYDVYLASSCTEEIAGDGASRIRSWLQEHQVDLFLICDEGGALMVDPLPGVKGIFAMTGVFEKGHGNVRFIARGQGGHASAPGANTPLVRLARFIKYIEDQPPMEVQFEPAVLEMFRHLAPYADFKMKFVFGNLWLFGPVLKKLMPRLSSQGAAMLKTTIAFTQAQGSQGANVIPDEAWVLANLRFIPHQKAADSLAVLEKIAARFDLEVEVLQAFDPTRPVDTHQAPYQSIEKAISMTFPQVPAIPYVVTGATDCRFYEEICPNAIRFAPLLYRKEQLEGMHGANETIETICLPGAVDFYKNLIRVQETRQDLESET